MDPMFLVIVAALYMGLEQILYPNGNLPHLGGLSWRHNKTCDFQVETPFGFLDFKIHEVNHHHIQ
jgi:hypothetical protein